MAPGFRGFSAWSAGSKEETAWCDKGAQVRVSGKQSRGTGPGKRRLRPDTVSPQCHASTTHPDTSRSVFLPCPLGGFRGNPGDTVAFSPHSLLWYELPPDLFMFIVP